MKVRRHRFIVPDGDGNRMEDETEDQERIDQLEQRIAELEAQQKQLKAELDLYRWRVSRAFATFLSEDTDPQEYLDGSKDDERE